MRRAGALPRLVPRVPTVACRTCPKNVPVGRKAPVRRQWKAAFRRVSLALTLAALVVAVVLTITLPRGKPRSEHLAVNGAAASAATTEAAPDPTTPVPTTYADQAYGAAAEAPTKDKPQSKLWFNDGSWWS